MKSSQEGYVELGLQLESITVQQLTENTVSGTS